MSIEVRCIKWHSISQPTLVCAATNATGRDKPVVRETHVFLDGSKSRRCVQKFFLSRRRKGKDNPVVRKALVDLDGPVFQAFKKRRASWALEDAYRCFSHQFSLPKKMFPLHIIFPGLCQALCILEGRLQVRRS